jgi:apolipoprotein N-acyltransferase
MFDLTAAGWPVAVAIFSLGAGVVGIATPPDGFTIRSFAFTAALVLTELIRWNYPFGGTPIATYAMVGVSTPFWITARTFGSPGLTVVVAWAGLAIGQLVQRRRDIVIAVGMVIVLVVGGMLGSYRVETVDTVDVAVVQGGGPQNTRADVCTTRAVFERHMAASETIDREVDLVIWPEDVVHPAADGRPTPERCGDELLRTTEATERLTRLAADLDAVVVSGWFEPTADGLANANYSIAQSPAGTVTGRYDKVRLVPFGEFVPLRSFIENFSDEIPGRDVRSGTGPATLATDIGTLGISISWEVFFRSPSPRRNRQRRPTPPQPDQRVELLAHDRPEPADRLEPPPSGRNRPFRASSGAYRLLWGHRPRWRGAAAHRVSASRRCSTTRSNSAPAALCRCSSGPGRCSSTPLRRSP